MKDASPPIRRSLRWICLLGGLAIPARGGFTEPDPEPAVPLRLEWPRGPFYVGQVINARLIVSGNEDPTGVTWPAIPEVELHPAKDDPAVGSKESAISFALIPRRAGRIALPPIPVKRGDTTRSTPRKAFEVLPIPATGRTASFCGGVGPLTASAEARPPEVLVGETFEFAIVEKGPGAAGSIAVPDLPGLPVVSSRSDFDVALMTRTVTYRLRAGKAGEARIPPLRVSWFDPASGRFQTISTRAVSVRVLEVPILEATAVQVADEPEAEPPASPWWFVGLGSIPLLAAGVAVLAARRRPVHPGKLAARLARGLKPIRDGDELGRAINAALTEFFRQVGRRPPGALTPEEAAQATLALGGGEALAASARTLIADADRATYGGETAGLEEGKERAKQVLDELGASSRSREALGTGE